MNFGRQQSTPSRGTATAELVCGLASLGGAAFVGLDYVHRPLLNALDRFGFRELPATSSPMPHLDAFFLAIGSRRVLLCTVALAVLVCVWRDWRRACACIVGPLLAAFITEQIAKPLVAGNVSGFGGHSYPSGTVTAVAALATALSLAVPRALRLWVALVGVFCVCAVSAAVIAVRWHFPTDALGGTLVGFGAVMFFDGLIHLLVGRRSEL